MICADASFRFIDLRAPDTVQEWRSNSFASGAIKSMAVDPDETVVSIGFSSGWATELDLRTGLLQSRWKAHETELLQVH